ncbi:MAG: cobyrinic acid a,c-diamide synthase, partial [Actinomycetota bacterium]
AAAVQEFTPATPVAVLAAPAPAPPAVMPAPPPPPPQAAPLASSPDPEEARRPRHEEKVTFYCTGSDLTRIERARLTLRAEHKLASDRGRIVRAALAEILDDFEQRGADSALVARLRSRGE